MGIKTVSGYAFIDLDSDGVYDPLDGETLYEGLIVSVYFRSPPDPFAFVASMATNATGDYEIEYLEALVDDELEVRGTLPATYAWTRPIVPEVAVAGIWGPLSPIGNWFNLDFGLFAGAET